MTPPRAAPVRTSPRIAMLMTFLTDDLALTVREMAELRSRLDEKIRERGASSNGASPRTLYLPSEPLDEL